jgi:hypothetical protein
VPRGSACKRTCRPSCTLWTFTRTVGTWGLAVTRRVTRALGGLWSCALPPFSWAARSRWRLKTARRSRSLDPTTDPSAKMVTGSTTTKNRATRAGGRSRGASRAA